MDTVRLPGKRPKAVRTTEQEVDLLTQKMLYLEGILADLLDDIGKNKDKTEVNLSMMQEKVGACKAGLKDLESLLYGDPRFLITGLAADIKGMVKRLDLMQDNEEARTNQMKGVKIGLAVTSVLAAIPSLGYLLPALAKLLEII